MQTTPKEEQNIGWGTGRMKEQMGETAFPAVSRLGICEIGNVCECWMIHIDPCYDQALSTTPVIPPKIVLRSYRFPPYSLRLLGRPSAVK